MAALGFRHGFDWDHIAAITDITSTTTAGHAWVDPILEKVVGVTLVLLGVWVIYSVVQYLRGKSDFRLRSRWMLVFDLARNAWDSLQARIHGHEHRPSAHSTQYGPRTAFGVGMIHGVGAETGSQALLLAGIAGVTGTTGIVILLAFIVGLLLSNTLVAVVSASGFIGAQRMRTLYVIVGAFAGVASLVIGGVFIVGLGPGLPGLQQLLFCGGGQEGGGGGARRGPGPP